MQRGIDKAHQAASPCRLELKSHLGAVTDLDWSHWRRMPGMPSFDIFRHTSTYSIFNSPTFAMHLPGPSGACVSRWGVDQSYLQRAAQNKDSFLPVSGKLTF